MKKFAVACLALLLLASCTSLKRMTGQIDDTVLPGQRQEILPPDQQVLRDPNVVGNEPVPGASSAQPSLPAQTGAGPAPGYCDAKVDYCPGVSAAAGASKTVAAAPVKPTAKKPIHEKKSKKPKKKPKITAKAPAAPAGASSAPAETAPPAPSPQG